MDTFQQPWEKYLISTDVVLYVGREKFEVVGKAIPY